MFAEYNEEEETPFILNILMDKAQQDLHDIVSKIKKSKDKIIMGIQ
jgi:hypothetical protein